MIKEAKFWERDGDKIRCLLCPHRCLIPEGKRGVCRVRENRGGKLYTLIYGSASSVAVDPIEKKPLYHFYPGSYALSFGTAGCNLSCKHCQNYTISMVDPEDIYLRELEVDEPARLAKQYRCKGISWTYNEPTIWHEFALDASKIAKKDGLYVTYVSNGFINEDPFREIGRYLDGINIDVKSFRDDFYRKISGGRLEPVLNTCVLSKELGIHLEVTYLIIPTKNDSMKEIGEFCEWVIDKLGEDTPVHFTRFYPHYKMLDLSPTPFETLMKAFDLAKEKGLKFVYLGNVPHGDYENTYCPSCGNLLIERYGFNANIKGLEKDRCKKCGEKINIVMD